MIKNVHFDTQNCHFERFWPLSEFHFPACSTLFITRWDRCYNLSIRVKSGFKFFDKIDF